MRGVHLEPAVGVLLAEHLLVELAHRGARHLVDEGEGVRELPLGEVLREELAELLGRRGRALLYRVRGR